MNGNRNSDETRLVRRAQAGDEVAFREIVERYQAKVFSVIRGILHQNNDAEDVAQQVFARVYFSIQDFEYRGSLFAWIYRIAVNESYEYLRKRKIRRLVYESDCKEEETSRIEMSHAGHEAPADVRIAQKELVLKLLARLSEEERYLLLMKEVEGYLIEELSQMTGINENSIKVKLFRARRKLLKAAGRLRAKPLTVPAAAGLAAVATQAG